MKKAELEAELARMTRQSDKHYWDYVQASARVDKLSVELREARQALTRIRDCDWVITLPDRMDAVRQIAREALEETVK